MAYIYLITNDINGKQYVGKTYYDNIQERWNEHLRDYKKPRCEKRPLYDAMNKYGIEHFHIQEIEYVSPEVNLEEREIYWIAQYNTYQNGYNATLGGDGKRYLDYDLIYKLWKQGLNCTQISEQLDSDRNYIGIILKNFFHITSEDIKERQVTSRSMLINQIDKTTNKIIAQYSSMNEAARIMLKQGYTNCKPGTGSSHISQVCSGKRKTFAGFKWQKVE